MGMSRVDEAAKFQEIRQQAVQSAQQPISTPPEVLTPQPVLVGPPEPSTQAVEAFTRGHPPVVTGTEHVDAVISFLNAVEFGLILNYILLLFGLVVATTVLVWLHNRREAFDLANLICTDGKINDKKFTRMGAFLVSTWGFYVLTAEAKMTEWYFVGYMGVWVVNALGDKWLWEKLKKEPEVK